MPATVALFAVVVYIPSWSHPFVYDDLPIVRDNPVVFGDAPWRDVFTKPYWSRGITADPLYRPVTTASFRLNATLLGHRPVAYHVVSTLLHALAAVLLVLTANLLWNHPAAGWTAGLLFAAHPINCESVVPIVGRSELLVMIFVILMIYVRLDTIRRAAAPAVRRHLVLSLFYALACFSKEQGILGLLAVAAVDMHFRREFATNGPAPNLRESLNALFASHYLGLILTAAGVLFVRWSIFGWQRTVPDLGIDPAFNPIAAADGIERIATPFALLATAVQLIALPVNLCPIWSRGGIDLARSFTEPRVLAGFVITASLLFAAATGLKRRRRVALPVAVLLIFLVLPCHFVHAANWFFAERWLYLPAAMVALTVAGAAAFRPRATAVFVSLATVALTVNTWHYQRSWSSGEALIRVTVERQPNGYIGLVSLCQWLERHGQLDEMPAQVARLQRHHPDAADSWYFHAVLLAHHGRTDDAARAFDRYYEMARLLGAPPRIRPPALNAPGN
ncbi:MAG: DUF1736 domain-containing protein [Phycisphaerales bacterium]|nr:DUF1736 domain-containing protein [Phycisphaerales bacterium]